MTVFDPVGSTVTAEYTTVVVRPNATELGGWEYPFVREWSITDWFITTQSVENVGGIDFECPELWTGYWTIEDGKQYEPTLRWINGDTVNDLYIKSPVDGDRKYMGFEEFLAMTKLAVNMRKGGMVASKRISRIMRRYAISGFFRKNKVKVKYLEQTSEEAKVWDGAGLISRTMLKRLIRQLPAGLSDRRKRAIKRELNTCKRVEFTIMGIGTDGGQDKGHAIVTEDSTWDFVLPKDTKLEITMNNGKAFVGINFVHGTDDMRLDGQSTINLHPFFSEDYIQQCLTEESQVFLNAVESGNVDVALNKIENLDSIDDLSDWYIMEYFASGGKAMHFASVVRGLIGQHLKRLNQTNLNKFRLPINGGRYYVMPIGVGKSSGVTHEVNEGEIFIDPEYGTAWVNDADWCNHIAEVLGGADNDDALWVHQFIDTDGIKKVLFWRSPNQMGEYMIKTPATGSHTIEWDTITGKTSWRNADSANLPARIDSVVIDYQNLVDTTTGGGLGEGHEYSIHVMDLTIERALGNKGALGMYCNMLMVFKGVFNKLPKTPPAPLEDVIDASVKTGADLSPIKEWCKDVSKWIVSNGVAIPHVLHKRVNPFASITATKGHWLDNVINILKKHIKHVEDERNQMAMRATPPLAVIEAGAKHSQLGKDFRLIYSQARSESGFNFKIASERSERYLSSYSYDIQKAAMLGTLYESYMGDNNAERKDGAAFQIGNVVTLTLEALRDIGYLKRLEDNTEQRGVIAFTQVNDAPIAEIINLNGVWFNLAQAVEGQQVSMSKVDETMRRKYKKLVAKLTETGRFVDRTFTVVEKHERKLLLNEEGVLIGYVDKKDTAKVTANAVKVMIANHDGDGNLRLVIA